MLTTPPKKALSLERARGRIAAALDELHEALFTPEMKLTFIARHPDNPECEIVVTADDLAAVRDTIDRSLNRDER